MQNRWVPFFVNRFIYLSLPFFDKSEEECETGFEKWIYVLKYMEVLERLPFTAQKKIFDHLAKLADVRCLSSEEQEKYDESIKAGFTLLSYWIILSVYNPQRFVCPLLWKSHRTSIYTLTFIYEFQKAF